MDVRVVVDEDLEQLKLAADEVAFQVEALLEVVACHAAVVEVAFAFVVGDLVGVVLAGASYVEDILVAVEDNADIHGVAGVLPNLVVPHTRMAPVAHTLVSAVHSHQQHTMDPVVQGVAVELL